MFGFAKKIKEYSKLGSAIDELNKQLEILGSEIEKSDDQTGYAENVVGLSFVIRKEVLDRIDEFNWSYEGPILVKSLHPKNITLLEAQNTIVLKIRNLSMIDREVYDAVEDILKKGSTYYQLQKVANQNRY